MSKPIGTAGGHPADDSDLEDLLASKAGGGSGTDNVDINLDHLTRDASSTSYGQRYQNYYGPPAGIFAVIYAHCCLFFSHRPAAGLLCTIMGTAACVYFFIYIVDPSGKVGVIKHDWTTVSSELDLKAGDIDHWCIGGGDANCRCEDPLIPADRGEYKSWVTAHAQNKKAIAEYADNWADEPAESKIDVAFLGESLIEEMDGRWLGMTKGEHLEELSKLFNKHFKKAKGGAVEGVALGIAGDTAPNVLWRLLHGEMPYEFNPKVWWVSLGMNDLARMKCSEEVVIMGIIRVVEEIKKQKPDAKIVINSLLPMHDFRSGLYPQQTDYRDAFRQDVLNRQRGWRGRPQVNVPPSHIARNPNKPNKEIQGEPEEGQGRGGGFPNTNPRKDRFPGGNRRLMDDGSDWMASEANVELSSAIERELRGGKVNQKLSREEQLEKHKAVLAAQREKEKAMREEAMAKHRERMEKLLAQRVKRDKVNPLLRNKQSYKKLDPKKFFMRKTQVPLWPAITAINNALRKFADKHDHVSFFDATYLFTERNGPRSFMLLSDMISPRGHPTDAGFQRWETAVAKKLNYMLEVKPGQKAEKKAAEAAAAGWQSQPQTPPAMPSQQQNDEDEDAQSKTQDEAESKTEKEDEEDEDEEGKGDKDEEEEEEEEEEPAPKKISTMKKTGSQTGAASMTRTGTQTGAAPMEKTMKETAPVKRAPTKKAAVVEDEEEEEDVAPVKRAPTKNAVEDEEEEEDVAPMKKITQKKPTTKKTVKRVADDEEDEDDE